MDIIDSDTAADHLHDEALDDAGGRYSSICAFSSCRADAQGA